MADKRGFTNRQPRVVSCRLIVRLKALSALPSTNGARVILSTPPATKVSPAPVCIAWAAQYSVQASKQQGHTRHITVILASLVCATQDNIFDTACINICSPHRFSNHECSKI